MQGVLVGVLVGGLSIGFAVAVVNWNKTWPVLIHNTGSGLLLGATLGAFIGMWFS
jgi:hypothetical protein